jgi:hypothetical protein
LAIERLEAFLCRFCGFATNEGVPEQIASSIILSHWGLEHLELPCSLDDRIHRGGCPVREHDSAHGMSLSPKSPLVGILLVKGRFIASGSVATLKGIQMLSKRSLFCAAGAIGFPQSGGPGGLPCRVGLLGFHLIGGRWRVALDWLCAFSFCASSELVLRVLVCTVLVYNATSYGMNS